MEKYESLVAAVVFQKSGIYAYNRQQLCNFTTKDLNSEFCLQVGGTFEHNGEQFKITNIHFAITENWYSDLKNLNVFTQHDSNPINLRIYVLIENV